MPVEYDYQVKIERLEDEVAWLRQENLELCDVALKIGKDRTMWFYISVMQLGLITVNVIAHLFG